MFNTYLLNSSAPARLHSVRSSLQLNKLLESLRLESSKTAVTITHERQVAGCVHSIERHHKLSVF